MSSTSFLRLTVAASLYLLLMFGYMALRSPQGFAVFSALVLSFALWFWSHETARQYNRAQEKSVADDMLGDDAPVEQRVSDCTATAGNTDQPDDDGSVSIMPEDVSFTDSAELRLSMARLDALKAEIEQQYRYMGLDHGRLNIKSLGAWSRSRQQRGQSHGDDAGDQKD